MSTPPELGELWLRNNPDAGERTLPISEQFGPTIQGEGVGAGRSCQFIRTGGCNLSCSWCDTPYTWDGGNFDLRQELTPTEAQEIVERAIPNLLCIISGGEPLLHQNNIAWEYMLRGLVAKGCEVHIETNGTILPNEVTRQWVTLANVSPKLPHAGQHVGSQNPAMHPGWSKLVNMDGHHMGKRSILKVVARDAEDVERAVAIANEANWPLDRTWVMPLGTSEEELQSRWAEVAAAAAAHHVNASHRLHVLAWGDTKGT